MKTDNSPGFFRMQALAAAIGLASGAAHAVDPIVTSLADNGPGSLRQAMLDASEDGGVASLITFSEGLSGTISLQSPLPTMNDTVDIRGGNLITVRGPSVSEGQAVFSFYSESAQSFTLRGLTITGSNAGAVDGRIYGGSSMLLQDMVITRNTDESAVNVRGGNMVILSSEITGNKFQVGTGGSYGNGAGIRFRNGSLTLEDTTVSDNKAGGNGQGGGIDAGYANITVQRSVISGNSAGRRGGGIHLYSYEGTSVTIEDSTISGNTADRSGGLHLSSYEGASLTIRNSSISANQSTEDGGGLGFFNGRYSESSLVLENSVIEGNKSGDDDGAMGVRASDVTISGSVISNNSAADDRGAFRMYSGSVNISRSTISGNKARGSAVGRIGNLSYFNGLNLTLDETTISGHSTNEGTGLRIRPGYGGSVLVANSTISGNTAQDAAIEIDDFSYSTTPDVEIRNSTFSGNRSTRAVSAIQLTNVDLNVINSTFVNNSGSRSQFFEQSAQLSLHNTTESAISGQLISSVFTSGNDVEMIVGGPEFSPNEPGFGGYVAVEINNVIMTSNIAVGEGSNLINAPRVEDAGLAPLGYRGGFTLVHEPLPGSSAIDSGSESSRPDNRDQRGLSGNVNYNSDIGAVEVVANTPPRMVVNLGKQISGKVGTGVPPFSVRDLFVDDEGDIISTLSVTGLPPGLTFNEGMISGSLNVSGSFAVTAVLTDNNARPLQTVEQFVVDVTDGSGGGSSSGGIPAGVLALFGFLALMRRRTS